MMNTDDADAVKTAPSNSIAAGTYVENVLQYLTAKAPGFLDELRSIELPPINFKQCLKLARSHVSDIVTQLSSAEAANSAIRAAEKQAEVTFSFLLVQLHVRGSASFWSKVEKDALFCFVAFATVDLMVDALSHIPNNDVTGFNTLPLIASTCDADFLKTLEAGYDAMYTMILKQHVENAQDWHPTEQDVDMILDKFTRAIQRHSASSGQGWSPWQKASLAICTGVLAYIVYRRLLGKSN